MCCRAFVLWFEGSSARCYGVSSAASTAQTPVLVVGHGGAEHAFAWKLSQSLEVGCVYVAPGNGGTAVSSVHGHRHSEYDGSEGVAARHHAAPIIPVDVPLTPPHFKEVKDFCLERSIVLAVVGSHQLLLQGLSDALRGAGIPTFGPSQAAAEIDSSHNFSRHFAKRLELPLADLDGDAEETAAQTEVSVVAFSDGTQIVVVPAATQDQKRCHDDNRGPVTDGMGAFAPTPLVDSEAMLHLEQLILRPLFEGLRAEDRPFVGCLQTELVLTASGFKITGFRASLGEPVAQTILPLLDGDLFEVLSSCAAGRLKVSDVVLRENNSSVAVVMASEGYPGPFERGQPISGLERALCVPGACVFHTGTAVEASDETVRPMTPVGSHRHSRPLVGSSYRAGASDRLLTCGGRVLTVTALGRSLNEARERAYVAVRAINFPNAFYRHDIAALASLQVAASPRLRPLGNNSFSAAAPQPQDLRFTYRAAGVDSAACEAALRSFEPLLQRTVSQTQRDLPWTMGSIMKEKCFETAHGVLVSTSSTLGTKVKVAARCGNYDGLGVDLVALCVNDVVARGAEPLFFQEQCSTEKLDGHEAMRLVQGASDGCVEAGCRLMGAGVSELPGVFAPGGLDIVGFAVGMAQEGQVLPKQEEMMEGDVIIGLPAAGLHCNGFSLVRAIIKAAGLDYGQAAPFDPTRSLGEALLPPTRIYVKSVLAAVRQGLLKGAVQVAAGGLGRCFDTLLPPHLSAQLRADSWEFPAVLRWLAAVGRVPCEELISTFNCGLGMMLVVSAEFKDQAMKLLMEMHEEPVVVGKLLACARGQPRIEVEGAQGAWLMLPELGVSLPFPEVLSSLQDPWTVSRMRVVVLVGSEDINPMQALLQATRVPASAAVIVAVVCCDPGSRALAQARAVGVKDLVLGDGRFKEADFFCEGLEELDGNGACADAGAGANLRPAAGGQHSAAAEFCGQMEQKMAELQAELLLVLDDADTSLLTRAFVQRHLGKVMICHSSLLPAFPGASPIATALKAGVCVTGFTVSFAVPPLIGRGCHGPQILQETVRIEPNDNATTLRQRLVTKCQVPALPRALQLVAARSVSLRHDDEGFGVGRSASFSEAASAGMLISGRPH